MTTSQRRFTQAQRKLLAGVLNRIIPSAGGLPGAGDLGVAEFVETWVSKDNRLRRQFNQSLAQIEITAAAQGRGFLELSGGAQDAVLKQVESEQPQFFDALVLHTYNGYYTNPQVFQLIGYTQSAQDQPPELLDPGLLEKQRQRAPFWHQV
jgi:hypothetical protein